MLVDDARGIVSGMIKIPFAHHAGQRRGREDLGAFVQSGRIFSEAEIAFGGVP
jgi:hypothetical protein